VLKKPVAVVRRDIMANTGPHIYGLDRMDKVRGPSKETFTYLGVADGIVHLERDDKTKGEPFIEIDSVEFADWKKI
jgi:hypothetical protein